MNLDAFWKIVDGCRRAEAPEEALAKKLRRLDPAEVASFDALFRRVTEQAFRWDLWGAAYLIEGGCSEDGFIYFLCGLISKGRMVYERALTDADWLASVDVTENEEFGQVAAEVYEELAGKPLRSVRWKRTKPAGKRWDFESATANARRLPKLQRRAAREAARAGKERAEAARANAMEKDPKKDDSRKAAAPQWLDPTRFIILADEARDLWKKEDWAGAIRCYRQLLKDLGEVVGDPRIPYVHGDLMALESDLTDPGALDRARAHFDAAVRTREYFFGVNEKENEANRSSLDNQLAWFLYEHGSDDELPEALEHARRARAGTVDLMSVRDTEMRILLRLGREAEARALVKQVLRKDPKQALFQDVRKRWRL